MSKYLLDKFLYTVDRAPELVERYRSEPRETVQWWEAERANAILNVHSGECSTWLKFDEAEREALATHDYPRLFELGVVPLEHGDEQGQRQERVRAEPLGFQLEYAQRLSRFKLPYPDITT